MFSSCHFVYVTDIFVQEFKFVTLIFFLWQEISVFYGCFPHTRSLFLWQEIHSYCSNFLPITSIVIMQQEFALAGIVFLWKQINCLNTLLQDIYSYDKKIHITSRNFIYFILFDRGKVRFFYQIFPVRYENFMSSRMPGCS